MIILSLIYINTYIMFDTFDSLSSYQIVDQYSGTPHEFYSPQFTSLNIYPHLYTYSNYTVNTTTNYNNEITTIHTNFPLGPLGKNF